MGAPNAVMDTSATNATPQATSPRNRRGAFPAVMQTHSTDTMNIIGTAAFNSAIENATEESVIVELTRRLARREAELRTITEQKEALQALVQTQSQHAIRHAVLQAGDASLGAEAYNTLLAHYMEREEELRLSRESHLELEKKVQTLNKSNTLLQENSAIEQRRLNNQEALVAEMEEKLATVDDKSKSLRSAINSAEEVIKKQDDTIDLLKRERDALNAKMRESEDRFNREREDMNLKMKEAKEAVDALEANIAGYEGHIAKSFSQSEKHSSVLQEQLKISAHAIESKDALLNMQRQELGRLEDLVHVYETKFESKGRDIPKIVARADEGDRIWSKIEEREKRLAAKEATCSVLKEENRSLREDKARLRAEVDELHQCFKDREILLSGTKDKVHMPWLLAQLRDIVTLREENAELKEIIDGGGYTVRAAEAEADFRARGGEIASEMEKLVQVTEMLRGQAGAEDPDVPVLIGKLEECLAVFGEDVDRIQNADDLTAHNVSLGSAASVDSALSLVSAESAVTGVKESGTWNTVDERWMGAACITPRDLKEFMLPRHYSTMNNLVDGISSIKTDGLYVGDDDDDAETRRRGDDDDETRLGDEGRTARGAGDDDGDAGRLGVERVLRVVTENEEELEIDAWQDWLSPSRSPCSQNTAADE